MSKPANLTLKGGNSVSLKSRSRRIASYLTRPLRKSQFFSLVLACRYDLALLLKGARVYRKTGVTPDNAYQSLIDLHCRTRGYSNDILAWILKLKHRPISLPNANGVMGNLSRTDIERITGEVRQNGFYIFPHLLPAELCDHLVAFATKTNCRPFPAPAWPRPPAPYERSAPIAETYRFEEQALLDDPQIQKLIADHSILALAQSYLGTPPILDIVTMWWSTARSSLASAEAAQLYHFDMDRIKWLKFFFYLTDVTHKTGAHCYVARSHRRGKQPRHLLARGYARIPDHDIESYYEADDIKQIVGPKGTIFIADTRGFHKGTPLETGDRLVLQFEFCNNLFGGPYTKAELRGSYDSRLLELARKYRRIYSKFTLDAK
jgi:hypothetical protein